MTNPLYAGGPFDGTAIGASFNGLPTTPLLQPVGERALRGGQAQLDRQHQPRVQAMYVWHTAPIQTLSDLYTKEMSSRAGAGLDAIRLSGARARAVRHEVKIITGYEATPKIHLAMERGEVHGTWANWSTLKAIASDWIKDKKIRILRNGTSRSIRKCRTCRCSSTWPRPPDQKQALDLALARLEFGRRSSCRRRASGTGRCGAASVRRHHEGQGIPGRRGEAQDRGRSAQGEQVAELVGQLYKTPAEVVARVRAAMAPK